MNTDSQDIQDKGSEMSSLINDKDWSQTSLGPKDKWPAELKVACNIMLEAAEAIRIYWGEDLVLLYNDLAREQIGTKHPDVLGRPAKEVFPEAWETLGPIHEQVMAGNDAVRFKEKKLPFEHNGEIEDIWWNSSFSPIPTADGSIGGVLNISVDITARKQAELKREQFLLKLSDAIRPLSDPVKIQKEAARIVGEHLGLDRAHYCEVLADENTNTVYADYHQAEMTSLVGEHQLNEFGRYFRENFLAGNTMVIDDFTMIEELSDEERAMYKKTNITAWVGVPLVKDGRFRAYFVANQSKPREWSALEVQIIEETAERTWAAVEQARAERDLRESEERLDVAVRNSPLTVWQMDTDLRYTWIEHPHREFKMADVLGKRDDELLSPDEAETVMTPKRRAMETSETVREEVTYNLPTGEEVSYDLTITPLRDERGEITGVTGAAFDITERKKTERELQRSEERLQMAQDTAQLGYWELNIDTKTFSCSPICKAHFGREPEDAFGYEDIIKSIHPDDWKTKKQIMQNALEKGDEYDIEYRINWPDGTRRWIYTCAQTLGKVELAGVTLDITERKEIEEALEQRTKAVQTSRMKLRSLVNELSQAEENQRYILAGELHDNLGQILEVCKMKFDVLMKNNSANIPLEVHEIRNLINDAISCTRRLVYDLKPTPTEEKEDLNSALKWVAGKMEKHGLAVNIENDKKQKAVAQGSLNTLVQAVQELLFNVVKHAETDRAWLTVSYHKNFLQIKVKDKGKGFDPEQLEESEGQEGFGLFNVRQRIDLLGGTLTIESEPGKGTTAVIQMPVKRSNTPDGILQFREITSTAGSVLTSTAVISVMVVDDHQMMREGIAGIINTENDMFVVDEAPTGEEAIRKVGKVKPDVVIMDINLPGINGIEATKQVKKDYPNTKVIGISFLNDQELINNVFNAGASDFIGKDETLQSICQAIREVVVD